MSTTQVGIKLGLQGVSEVTRGLGQVDTSARSLDGRMDNLAASARGMAAGLVGAAAVIGGIRTFVTLADQATQLDARLKLATKSSEEFAQAQDSVYRIAQANGAGLQEVAALFGRLSEPVQRMGGSMREVSAITDAFAKALRVGGASAAESSSAILQFSQAMASGALRGEEFNAINEASPRIMKALADGMGVPTGALKKMAEEGKLTADVVGNALVSQLDKLSSEAAQIPMTVGGAFQLVKNEALLASGAFDQATGVTSGLVDTFKGFSGVIREVAPLFKDFGAAVGSTGEGFDLAGVAIRAFGTTLETLLLLGSDVAYIFNRIKAEAIGIGEQIGALLEGDFSRIGEIRARMIADSEKAAADLEAYQRRVAGMTDRVMQAREALKAIEGVDTDAEDARLMRQAGGFKQLEAAATGAADAQEKAAKAAAKHGEELDKLAAAIKAEQAGLTADFQDRLDKLSEARRTGRLNLEQYTEAVQDLLSKQPSIKEAAEAEKKWAEEQARRAMEGIKEYEAREAAIDASLEKAREMVDAIEGETVALGMSNAEREIHNALLALEKAGLEKGSAAYEAYAEEVRGAILDREAVKASIGETERLNESWKKQADQINQSLTDSLMRAFESGKGFFDAMWSSIKNTLMTQVLRPIISAVVSPISIGMAGLMGGSGAANAAQQASGAGGMLGNLGSLAGLIGSGLGGGLSAGFGAAMSGNALSALSGGWTMFSGGIGAGSAAGASAGLGTMLGAIGPYAAAAAAVYAIYKALDDSGTPHVGGRAIADGSGVRRSLDSELSGFDVGSDKKVQQQIEGMASNLQASFGRLGQAFGLGQARVGLGFADDSSKDGSWGAFELSLGSRQLANWGRGNETRWPGIELANGEEGFQQFLARLAGDTRSALDSIQLPQWARDRVATLSASATLDEVTAVIDGIAAMRQGLMEIRDAFLPLGSTFASFATASEDAQMAVVGLVGGLDQLRAKAAGFVTNYFTEDEQTGLAAQEITRALRSAGFTDSQLAGLDSRADFRALLESVNVGTTSGQQQFAALLNVQQQFADLSAKLVEGTTDLLDLLEQAPEATALGALNAAQAQAATTQTDSLVSIDAGITSLVDQTGEVIAALSQVRDEIRTLRENNTAENAAIASSTLTTSRILDRVTEGGDALLTVAAA